jgi:formate dehydrogenase (NADP+) beta subunit
MGARITLPQLAHWKAQVKCQAGCPVATDAGRYVQLARGASIEFGAKARSDHTKNGKACV